MSPLREGGCEINAEIYIETSLERDFMCMIYLDLDFLHGSIDR